MTEKPPTDGAGPDSHPVRQSELIASAIRRSMLKWATGIALLTAFLGSLVQSSRHVVQTERTIAMPMEFRLRSRLGQDPAAIPNLKILIFEDNSFSAFQKPSLSLEEWGLLLSALAERRPKAIFIDKIFGALEDTSQKAEETFRKLASLETPIYAGAFTSPAPIVGRPRLELEYPQYQLSHYVRDSSDPPPLLDVRHEHAYAATPQHQRFLVAGHINYPGNLQVSPLVRLTDRHILPHIGLYAAGTLEFRNGALHANGHRVPISDEGLVAINFLSPHVIYSKNRICPFKAAFQKIRKKTPIDFVAPGDLVLVIPSGFTGSVDFKETPFGPMPGGMIIAAMINSAVSGQWIRFSGYGWLFAFLVTFLGAAIALSRGMKMWVFLVAVPVVGSAISMYAFVARGIHAPWLLLTIQFLIAAVLVIAQRSRFDQKREQALIETEEEFLTAWQEQKRLQKEKNEAAIIAAAFKPDPLPTEFGPYEVTGYHHCYDAASGDWYFFEASPNGEFYHFVMCDITGHGVQAALVVSTCKSILSFYRQFQPDVFNERNFIKLFAESVNRVLHTQGKQHHTTTLCGIMLEPGANRLAHLTCAHPFPLVFNRTAEGLGETRPKPLISRNSVLGMEPGTEYVLRDHPFLPGDELVVFSDGLQIPTTARIVSRFVHSRQEKSLAPEDCVRMIFDEQFEREGSYPEDDISLVVFRFRQESAAVSAA